MIQNYLTYQESGRCDPLSNEKKINWHQPLYDPDIETDRLLKQQELYSVSVRENMNERKSQQRNRKYNQKTKWKF